MKRRIFVCAVAPMLAAVAAFGDADAPATYADLCRDGVEGCELAAMCRELNADYDGTHPFCRLERNKSPTMYRFGSPADDAAPSVLLSDLAATLPDGRAVRTGNYGVCVVNDDERLCMAINPQANAYDHAVPEGYAAETRYSIHLCRTVARGVLGWRNNYQCVAWVWENDWPPPFPLPEGWESGHDGSWGWETYDSGDGGPWDEAKLRPADAALMVKEFFGCLKDESARQGINAFTNDPTYFPTIFSPRLREGWCPPPPGDWSQTYNQHIRGGTGR